MYSKIKTYISTIHLHDLEMLFVSTLSTFFGTLSQSEIFQESTVHGRVALCDTPCLWVFFDVLCSVYSSCGEMTGHVGPCDLYPPPIKRKWWLLSYRVLRKPVCVLFGSGGVCGPCSECWEVIEEVMAGIALVRRGQGMCGGSASPCTPTIDVFRISELTLERSFFTL